VQFQLETWETERKI